MTFGVARIDRQKLLSNLMGFAKATREFEVPGVLSTVGTRNLSKYLWPMLQKVYARTV